MLHYFPFGPTALSQSISRTSYWTRDIHSFSRVCLICHPSPSLISLTTWQMQCRYGKKADTSSNQLFECFTWQKLCSWTTAPEMLYWSACRTCIVAPKCNKHLRHGKVLWARKGKASMIPSSLKFEEKPLKKPKKICFPNLVPPGCNQWQPALCLHRLSNLHIFDKDPF